MELALAALAAVATVAIVVVGLGLLVVFAPTLRAALTRAAGAVHDVACDLIGSGFVTGTGTRSGRRGPRSGWYRPVPEHKSKIR
jgi:hypothetical protein